MSCGCTQPDKTPLWTPIPEFRSPTSILPGENIDCYAKRSGSLSKNDVAEKLADRINNTSITTDLNLKVDEQFSLTPGSTRIASEWVFVVNSVEPTQVLPELHFEPSGRVYGTVQEAHANQRYKILVIAKDATGEIDSIEYNFYPKKGSKDDTIQFVFPYAPNGRVTCKFGPRNPPAFGASSMHHGIDISQPGDSSGFILAAADGVVVKCGPASGFGNWVVIEHRNAKDQLVATTVYGHMNEWYVKVGQRVAAGQRIALEGNAGIGTAKHLHFELHRGAFRNPIDPLPYINGSFSAADNNLPGENGIADPSSYQTIYNTNKGMTYEENDNANADCPLVLPNQAAPSVEPGSVSFPANFKNLAPTRSLCATAQPFDLVLAQINKALDEEPLLNEDDKKFLLQCAKIESNLDPSAVNPASSAMGLFQMLDKTATVYYGQIGVVPNCKNRCDPYYATKAQVKWYMSEFKKYWNEFSSSNKTKVAGQVIKQTPWSAQYPSLTFGEFMYMIHHDGIGNVVSGKDLQGVDYWRKKIREA